MLLLLYISNKGSIMDVKIKDKYWLMNGDCVTEMKKVPAEKCDAMITDPPAGIKFMGKNWDDDKGGRDEWINWLKDIMAEALRCLKPGAHGLVWALPRTSHWTTMALENAGFEVRDVITHLFGTGFPKSHNISKAIDKELGIEREKIKISSDQVRNPKSVNGGHGVDGGDRPWMEKAREVGYHEVDSNEPVSEEAKKYDGWGSALKPASEHWILIRKPLSEKSIASNVLKFGTGGINIDESRIGLMPGEKTGKAPTACPNSWKNTSEVTGSIDDKWKQGRFPANLVLSHNVDCEDKCTEGCAVKSLDEQSRENGIHSAGKARPKQSHIGDFGINNHGKRERLADNRFGDSGGASRFFYCAKASGADKNKGLEDLPAVESDSNFLCGGNFPMRLDGTLRKTPKNQNIHPTVKNTKLMEYLIKLITPENGIVLDPFMGSGTTGVSARNLNKKFIGIEKESEYFTIAKSRLEYTNVNPEQWEPMQKVS